MSRFLQRISHPLWGVPFWFPLKPRKRQGAPPRKTLFWLEAHGAKRKPIGDDHEKHVRHVTIHCQTFVLVSAIGSAGPDRLLLGGWEQGVCRQVPGRSGAVGDTLRWFEDLNLWLQRRKGLPLGNTSKSGPDHLARVIWVWVKIKPPGIGPQVLVMGSIYEGSILGAHF